MTTELYRTGKSLASIPELISAIPDTFFDGIGKRRSRVVTGKAGSGSVHKGDQFSWRAPNGGSYGDAAADVYMVITRLAKDGSWADIHCQTWAVGWGKRHTLPLPEGFVPCKWDQEDLDAQEQAWLSQQK